MLRKSGWLGIFAEPAQAARAVRALHDSGFYDVRAAMPAPFTEVIAALGERRSRVGRGVLVSTLLGVLAGFAMCILTSRAWPLVTGGKPIVSLPTFTVVAFEVSVLVGGTATHAMLAFATVTGRWRRRIPTKDPRFSADRIGIFVPSDSPTVEQVLRRTSAEEVRRVA
jgi:Protein of unknown function (DUF3341)